MRAREPDVADFVVLDGVNIGYEVFGEGEPTILLMPTWTLIGSRFWKAQVPYLSRHYRVITYDGPGNGRTDRTVDPEHYSVDFYLKAGIAVLDRVGADNVIVVGLSQGAEYAVALASEHPGRVKGVALVCPGLGLAPPSPERAPIWERFTKPYPPEPQGWEKYNLAYWNDHYEDFLRFFMGEIFSEEHSTKQFEDAVGWGLETRPEILEAEATRPAPPDHRAMVESLSCPVLVIHGTDDHIIPYEVGVEAARITGGKLHTMVGSGHNPLAREPVKVNLVLRDFIEQVRP